MAATNTRKPKKSDYASALQALTTPLTFLGLALLIIEATLAIVLSGSKLSEDHVWEGFLWMVGIFIGVLVVATLFFWLNPKNLLFGKEEHANPALEPSTLKDQVEDLIALNVKPECLKSSDS